MRKTFAGMVCGVSVVLLSFAQNAAPPKQRTIAEWAEQERVVSADSGSRFPGPWSNERAPYGVEIMEACSPSDPSIIIAIRGSAQSAKSEFAMNAIGHTIQDAPKGILAVLPSGDEASKYSELKLDPMFKASPALARCVYKTSSANRGKISRKPFRNGFIQITTAGSDKGLQMLTVGLAVTEELGSWPEKSPGDKGDRGDPFEQTQARGTTYGEDFKLIAPSTTGIKGKCRITALFEDGDQRFFYWQCPECGDHFNFKFEHMVESEGRACLAAPCCGSIIGHHHKTGMNRNPRQWIPTFKSENPENPAPGDVIKAEDWDKFRNRDCEGRDKSFHIWQGISPFSTWKIIMEKYKAAKNDPRKMTVFYQQVLGLPYESAVDVPSHEKLMKIRGGAPNPKTSPVRRGIIPPWAGFVTMACDLQGNRGEWSTTAWGPGHISAVIDHGIIQIDPLLNEFWRELRRVFSTEWPSAHLRPQIARKMGIDTAGNQTQKAYNFVSANPDVIGIKSMTGPRARFEPIMQWSRKGGKMKVGARTVRIPLLHPNSHLIKKIIYKGLDNALLSVEAAEVIPGYNLFFHEEVSSEWCRQITAEYLLVDPLRDLEKWERISEARANEQLDLAVYNYLMALQFGIDRMTDEDWQNLFTREMVDASKIDMGPLELLMAETEIAPIPRPAAQEGKIPGWLQRMNSHNEKAGDNS